MGEFALREAHSKLITLETSVFRVHNRATGTTFDARANESILDAAMRQGCILPYSCRSGSCASCKAVVLSGRVDRGTYDEDALTQAEVEQGKVLLCQARALEDLVIEAREVAAAASIDIRVLPCRVAHLQRLAHDVMAVHLALPRGQTLSYLAGQYIDVLLRDGSRRSFSLAGRPGGSAELEIHVRRVPGGRFTTHVFESMKERDLLRFEGPLGTFFLREESDRPVVFMAGGTGLAPIKSIVEDSITKGIARPMHLFWGVRALRDLYLNDVVESWCRRLPQFRYTPVLSEPLPQDRWSGSEGWVHDKVVATYPALGDFDVYASGPPPMIDAARHEFARHGLPEDQFYYDSFEFADPRSAAS